jgi:hypothetical protein
MVAPVSLKNVVQEIEALCDEGWTAYLNCRAGELCTVMPEMADAVDEPKNCRRCE